MTCIAYIFLFFFMYMHVTQGTMEYWDVINEAIVRLRGRKNRPDVDNILGVLNKKKPTISKNVLENALNHLEKHNKLYRVYYKGESLDFNTSHCCLI